MTKTPLNFMMIVIACVLGCAVPALAQTDGVLLLSVEPEYTDGREIAELVVAAQEGEARAMTVLAWRYKMGCGGVGHDMAESMRWLIKAAEAGDTRAMIELGDRYLGGVGVEWHQGGAVTWYRRAAEQNDINGIASVGILYEHGYGVKEDRERAREIYLDACSRGSSVAIRHLLVRIQYPQEDPPNQNLTEDESKAIAALLKRSRSNIQIETYEMAMLARLYHHGIEVDVDHTQAMNWLYKAIDLGDSNALALLGYFYIRPTSGMYDEQKGVECLLQAAQRGDRHAMGLLFVYYFNKHAHLLASLPSGSTSTRSYFQSRAYYWLIRAAEQRHRLAISRIANMYANQQGVILTDDDVRDWYKRALDDGYLMRLRHKDTAEFKPTADSE